MILINNMNNLFSFFMFKSTDQGFYPSHHSKYVQD